ncbi:hypothetical protein F5Y11DRAFT_137428 [Daldinia sp. FL1419]|nr:hypothetical protein F5Y11DRAFT_137428 [Daldinia sp. FL1419]
MAGKWTDAMDVHLLMVMIVLGLKNGQGADSGSKPTVGWDEVTKALEDKGWNKTKDGINQHFSKTILPSFKKEFPFLFSPGAASTQGTAGDAGLNTAAASPTTPTKSTGSRSAKSTRTPTRRPAAAGSKRTAGKRKASDNSTWNHVAAKKPKPDPEEDDGDDGVASSANDTVSS